LYRELEKKISELDGVVSCRVTGAKDIDEIHIVATKSREPKRLVRDVETMVMVNLGKEIDHKKISIAQVNSPNDLVVENRVEIISIYRENNRPTCHFKLRVNGNLVEEEFHSSVEEIFPETIVEGLIKIVEKYTSFEGKIRLENVFTTGINNEIVLVQIIVYKEGFNGEKERLVGASYINNELPLATGKAFLKALNRRLNSYT
jgi:hypothetical protein